MGLWLHTINDLHVVHHSIDHIMGLWMKYTLSITYIWYIAVRFSKVITVCIKWNQRTGLNNLHHNLQQNPFYLCQNDHVMCISILQEKYMLMWSVNYDNFNKKSWLHLNWISLISPVEYYSQFLHELDRFIWVGSLIN